MRERLSRLLFFLMDPEYSRRVALLSTNPIFDGLPHRTVGRLLPRMFEKQYTAGDIIFRAGDPGHGLFVVLDGEVEILRATADPMEGEEERLALLGANSAFGELALIDDHPRAATARVRQPTRVLVLYRSEFEALMSGEPRVALALARNLLRIVASYARRAALQQHAPAHATPGSRT